MALHKINRSTTLPSHRLASRRRFLVWGAFGAAAAAFAPGLAGCSGGTKHGEPDSTYAGSYRAAYTIPSVSENGTFSYSVARSGDIIGSFVDSSTNVTRAFSGHLHNDGNFSGTTMDGNNAYPTSGTISPVVSSSTGGNFNQMRNGVLTPGSFSFVTTGVTAPTDSPYAGAYSGSFGLSGQTAGPASYSIDKQGGVTGFVTTNGETGTLRGQVSNTGAFSGVVVYPSGQATLSGALATSAAAGQAAGNVVQTKSGVSTPGTFGAPIALPGNSSYLGAYRGTYGIPDVNEAGDLSFSVDPSGAITGSFNQNNNSAAGVFAGTIAGDGNFAGTISYPAASGSATALVRTIKGKVVAGTGNGGGKLQADFIIQDANGPVRPGNFDATLGAASNVDSIFRGAYGNFADVPAFSIATNPSINTNSAMSITIDKEGKLLGTVDRYQMTGAVTNDGRLTATLFDNNGLVFSVAGKLSKQVVPKDAKVPPTSGPGITGDLVVTIGGIDYPASFQIAGGFTGGN